MNITLIKISSICYRCLIKSHLFCVIVIFFWQYIIVVLINISIYMSWISNISRRLYYKLFSNKFFLFLLIMYKWVESMSFHPFWISYFIYIFPIFNFPCIKMSISFYLVYFSFFHYFSFFKTYQSERRNPYKIGRSELFLTYCYAICYSPQPRNNMV